MSFTFKCCVATCSNVLGEDGTLRFFQVPLGSKDIFNAWVDAIRFDDPMYNFNNNTIICSEHFTDDDYVLENGTYELSPTAVPSKFKFRSDSMESLNNVGLNSTAQNWDSLPFNNNLVNQTNNKANKDLSLSKPVFYPNTNEPTSLRKTGPITVNNSEPVRTAAGSTAYLYNNAKNNVDENDMSAISDSEFVEDVFVISDTENDSVDINSSNTSNRNRARKVLPKTFGSDVRPFWVLHPGATYKQEFPQPLLRRLRCLGRKNKRLVSRVSSLVTRKQDMLDMQIKYLELKYSILKAEEQFWLNGIDTTEYSVFRLAKEDDMVIPDKDIGYDVVLECKFEELQNAQSRIGNIPTTISREQSSDMQESAADENVIII